MDKTELEKLVAEGLSLRKMAKRLNKGHSTIRHWLGVYGLKTQLVYLCGKCGETDETKFYAGRHTECKRCCIHRSDYAKRTKEKCVEYKGGKCVMCGYDKCYAALDFHHDGDKDPNWAKMRNWSFERRIAELDKCILVCKNCHCELHFGTRKNGV